MREEFRGFTKIFSFTFRQQTRSKGYRTSTIGFALVLFLIPALILGGMAFFAQNTAGTPEPLPPNVGAAESPANPEDAEEAVDIDMTAVKKLLLIGADTLNERDLERLKLSDLETFLEGELGQGLQVQSAHGDVLQAGESARGADDTLLVVIEANREYDYYDFNVILPPDTGLTTDHANILMNALYGYGTELEAAYWADSEDLNAGGEGSAEEVEMQGILNGLTMVLTYVNIMVLYFVVLLYGQGVATSVVMEKSSKLMEVFLVSVKPSAIVLGKLLAISLASMLQLASWILAIILGLAAGTLAESMFRPGEALTVPALLDGLQAISAGLFTLPNAIMALCMVLLGILLYCALAAIGGSMASRQEDLSSANGLFVMILLVSFFACLLGGGMDGSNADAGWVDWIPFTAVLVTPARILLGLLPWWKAILSLLLVIGTVLLITMMSGRVYKMLALYRGDIPTPAVALEMYQNNRKPRTPRKKSGVE